MEEAPENSKELSNSAHADGMNEWIQKWQRNSTKVRRTVQAAIVIGEIFSKQAIIEDFLKFKL
jgi:hypothetical protein